jgi:hypothetical protein
MAENKNPFLKIENYEDILGNPRKFIENFCYITTKDGKFELFKINEPQNKLMELIEKQLAAKKPIRIRVLKARQMGFSTLISAIGFWWAAMNENSAYAVVAHKDSSASSIFEKNKIFYDNLPKAMKPRINRFNSEKISFNVDGDQMTGEVKGLRSKIFFGTAGGGELFRGETILFLHKSEIAFWEDKNGVLKKSLNATVPYSPFSAIIEETTANGYNEFKDDWDRSVRGNDDYIPLFVGWNELTEYRMKTPLGFKLTEREADLQKRYNLSDEQLCWRRFKIDNDYGGNELWFQQENPLTPEEAFISSGQGVFDGETIKKGYEASRPPIREMEMKSQLIREKLKIWEEPESREIIEHQQLARFSVAKQKYEYYDGDIETGRTTVFANYTIGVDTAGMGADYNQVVVWHNIKKTMVARLGVKNISEERLASIVVEIAKYYNDALVIPEVNYSHAICDYMMALGYDKIFLTESMSRIDKQKGSMEYGFKTTRLTKPPIISTLRALLNENPEAIPDRDFWFETEYYVLQNVATNTMNAVSGHHDDIIMSNAIAYYGSNSFQAKQNYTHRKIRYENEENNAIMDRVKKAERKSGRKLKKGVYNNNA